MFGHRHAARSPVRPVAAARPGSSDPGKPHWHGPPSFFFRLNTTAHSFMSGRMQSTRTGPVERHTAHVTVHGARYTRSTGFDAKVRLYLR